MDKNFIEYIKEIIDPGDENGNGMTVRFRLPSGLEIIGLATLNFYGGHWDLGPTWNYVVLADKPFLVDSGRFGQGKKLIGMLESVRIRPQDLEFVLISHGHEDHDGGLAELVKSTCLTVKAHKTYGLLRNKYPDLAPAGSKADFPAKCWHCPMPESFYAKNCIGYHQVLQELAVDIIRDGQNSLVPGIDTWHLAGHSPDCLAVMLAREAVIVGDIVLPDISPWPTREAMYGQVAAVLQPDYTEPGQIFGLRRYLKSLKKLGELASQYPDLTVLPAHRLFYGGRWNGLRLADRIHELIQHHIDRCGAILAILGDGAQTSDQIARLHFDPKLMEGIGSTMAANEILSHCELLESCGDVVQVNENAYAATGTAGFESYIQELEPDF